VRTGQLAARLRSWIARSTRSAAIGSTVSNGVPGVGAGNIEATGATDLYTFTAAAGQKVYFDEISGNCFSTVHWKCVDSDNAVIFDEQLGGLCTDVGERTLLKGGNYTIIVSGDNGSTGTYQFSILPVFRDEFSIMIGSVVSNGAPGPGAGNIEAAGATDVYTFSATPGQKVYFDEQSGNCFSAIHWKCADSDGILIFNEQLGGLCTDAGAKTLQRGGTYTITVSGDNGSTGTYQFQLWSVPSPDQFAIAISADDVFGDRTRLGDDVAVVGDDRRFAERMNLCKLRGRQPGLRVALIVLDLIGKPQFLQQPQNSLRAGVVEVMKREHGAFLRLLFVGAICLRVSLRARRSNPACCL